LDSVDQLLGAAAEVERLAGSIKVLLAGRAAQVDRKGSPERTAADVLARSSGCSGGAARGQVDLARRLASQPHVAAGLRDGTLSVEQARVVSDAVTEAPDEEARLVAIAQTESLKALRDAAAKAKAAADTRSDEQRHARIRDTRRLATWTSGTGAGEGAFRGPIDALAEIDAALDAHQDHIFRAARANGEPLPYPAARFDALLAMARASLRKGDTDKPVAKKILVRVDHTALTRGSVAPGETVDLPGYGPLPVTVAAQLTQDQVWYALLTKGNDVINVTNAQRRALVCQQTALDWTQPLCCIEGCDNRRFIETDHTTGWSLTHTTQHGDLDHPCHHHHALKTFYGYTFQDQGPGRRKKLIPPPPGRQRQGRQPQPTRAATEPTPASTAA